MRILIKRLEYSDKQTLGQGFVFSGLEVKLIFATLELAWKNNEPQVSCIPLGKYKVVPRQSEKFKEHFHVLNVPNREAILIHPANYYKELRGCIAVGQSHTDMNADGYKDLVASRDTMAKLLKLINSEFELEIV